MNQHQLLFYIKPPLTKNYLCTSITWIRRVLMCLCHVISMLNDIIICLWLPTWHLLDSQLITHLLLSMHSHFDFKRWIQSPQKKSFKQVQQWHHLRLNKFKRRQYGDSFFWLIFEKLSKNSHVIFHH